MARVLGRSPATVSRELMRKNSSAVGYASVGAEALSAARRSAGRCPPALPAKRLLAGCRTVLEWKWSRSRYRAH